MNTTDLIKRLKQLRDDLYTGSAEGDDDWHTANQAVLALEAAQQLGSPGKVGSNDPRTDYLTNSDSPLCTASQPAGEPPECAIACPEKQVCDYCQGTGGKDVHPAPQVPMPDYKALYEDLIYQVSQKFKDETRHQTAKRYIASWEGRSVQSEPAKTEQKP